MLTKVLDITIKTDNDAWIPEFRLPAPNRIVQFRHQADQPSVILDGSATGYNLHNGQVVDCKSYDNYWRCLYTVPQEAVRE